MKINYDKLFDPEEVEIKEDVSEIDAIVEFEEVLFAISEYIINYRKENKLTQKELAEKLKVNQTMISKLESGDYNPTFKQIYNMSQKLMNSSDLFVNILKNIEEKIRNISVHQYNAEIKIQKVANDYQIKKKSSSKIIKLPYKARLGGIISYEECTSPISNVG